MNKDNQKNLIITIIVVLLIVLVGGLLISNYIGNNTLSTNSPGIVSTTTDSSGNVIPNPTPVPNPNPQPTPPPVPPAASGTVGYIGCSNTWKTIEGYHSAGGTNMWEAAPNYGGGDAAAWAQNLTNRNPYWAEFDRLRTEHSETKTIWYQICAKKNLSYDQTYNDAVQVIAEAKRRIPGAQVYVSGLNGFDPIDSCNISGSTGGPYSDQAAAAIASQGIALKGPVLSTLTRSQTTDGCHPNDTAKPILGRELINFFH